MADSEDLEAKFGQRAGALSNGDFVLIESYSGYRISAVDPQGAQHLLPPDASDESLGTALLDALDRSRFLTLDEARAFFDLKRIEEQRAGWTESLMTHCGYKTKRSLFRNMMNCGIVKVGDSITLEPMIHDKLQAWRGHRPEDDIDDVVIPAASSPSEIGAALRLALSRCR
jgi:hypothetical protein